MLLGLKGIAMGARAGGKFKAGVYMTAGLVSLMLYTVQITGFLSGISGLLQTLTIAVYIAAAVLSLASFADYLVQFRKLYK